MAECTHTTLHQVPMALPWLCRPCGLSVAEPSTAEKIVDSTDLAYWSQAKPEAPTWPEHDPLPEVHSTDPRPESAPADPRPVLAIVKAATAAGWLVRVGYSRGPARAVKVGTYKMVETFGVWSAPHPDTGWRFYGMYERTVGAATGWKWDRIGIWKPGGTRFVEASVTDLKEFIAVRGSVLTSWFKAIHQREERKKTQAKTRPAATAKPKEGLS